MARKPGASGIIVLALFFGVITALLLGQYLRKQAEKEKQNWQPVVVASQDIGSRVKITREMIRVEHYPKDLIAEGVFVRPEEVENRMTKDGIKSKEQIRNSALIGEGQSATLAIKIHEGMRAVSIAVDEIKAGGTACQPGDRVDIIASYQDPRTRRELTKMILQNVLVLWVDRGRSDANGAAGGASTSMTLEVKPEQTELVKAAERSGTLSVTLRPPQDNKIIPSEGVTASDLTGGSGSTDQTNVSDRTPIFIVPPANASRQKQELTIIRGSEERTITP